MSAARMALSLPESHSYAYLLGNGPHSGGIDRLAHRLVCATTAPTLAFGAQPVVCR